MNVWTQLYRLGQQLYRQGLVLTGWAAVDKLARWITGGPVESFSKISEHIWLGGQPSKRGLKKMYGDGFRGIVNMRAELDYIDLLSETELEYLYLPTQDNESPSIHFLKKGVEFIHKMVLQGKVYIHCWEGLGRGPTLVAAYLVSCGQTPAEAWASIREFRPFIRPTDKQMSRLEEFHQLNSNVV